MPCTYRPVSALPTVARITAYASAADFSRVRTLTASASIASADGAACWAPPGPPEMPVSTRPSNNSRRLMTKLRCTLAVFDRGKTMRHLFNLIGHADAGVCKDNLLLVGCCAIG